MYLFVTLTCFNSCSLILNAFRRVSVELFKSRFRLYILRSTLSYKLGTEKKKLPPLTGVCLCKGTVAEPVRVAVSFFLSLSVITLRSL